MTKEEQVLARILKSVSEEDKRWVIMWHRDATKFYELLDPFAESPEIKVDGETYFCRRETRINSFDEEVIYEYEVFKWDKTYKEVPIAPNSDVTYKWKNWVSVVRVTSNKKFTATEMIRKALNESDLGKEN